MLKSLLVVVLVAFSAACNRETEDPRTRANRIADEVLAGDSQMWHEITGSTFVWTACRKGQVVVLIVDGSTATHELLNLQEQAVCGLLMDQMAAATLRLQKVEPQLASNLNMNPDWLYWAAERSRLKH